MSSFDPRYEDQSRIVSRASNPTINDDLTKSFQTGFTWVNTVTNDAFICTDASPGAAVWTLLGSGTGSGTVQSVALSLPSQFSVAGSPIVTVGTLSATWNTQPQNVVLASPDVIGGGTPGFRVLVPNDIPNLDTSKITSGILPVSRGGTGADLSGLADGELVKKVGTGFQSSGMVDDVTGTGTLTIQAVLSGNITVNYGSVGGTVSYQGHTHTLSALLQSGAATNQVPRWNGTSWVPASVGSWGGITGTLSDQTDLQAALNAKLTASSNLSDLTSASSARTNLGLTTIASTGSAADLSSGFIPAARMPALTGDVTSTIGTTATTIAASAVTNPKMAQMPATTLKGNAGGAPATPSDLTGGQVAAFLPVFGPDLGAGGPKGLVPPTVAGDANKALFGDGTWRTVSGGGSGTVTSVGLTVPSIFNIAGSPVTTAGTMNLTVSNQPINTVWAGPATGVPGAPSFRALVPNDIPSLPWSKITSGTPTTLAGYGITDAVPNTRTVGAGTGLTGGGALSSNVTLGLANTAVAAGTYGATDTVGQFTVDAQGRLTGAVGISIQVTQSQVTGLVTALSGKASTGAVGSTGITMSQDRLLGRNSAGTGAVQEITIGAGLLLSGGTLSATGGGGGGGVTSVGLSLPSIFNVTGSPVTGTGVLTGSLANQSANQVFAGPSSGGAAVPGFRALVSDDIPSLDTAKITTGTFATARLPSTVVYTDTNQHITGQKTFGSSPATTLVLSEAPIILGMTTQYAGIQLLNAVGTNQGWGVYVGATVSGGTLASPAATPNNTVLGGFAIGRHNGSDWVPGIAYTIQTQGLTSPSNHGYTHRWNLTRQNDLANQQVMALVNGVLAVGTGFDGIGPTNGFLQIQTPTLGNTAGSAERASLLTGSSIGNTHYLYSGLHRNANGSTWESASFRLQHVVDATAQQFLDFRGNAGATGSTVIGYGGSDFLTVSQSGKTTLVTPDTNKASLNLPPGVAPSSPVDGDVWRTSNGLFGRHGATTVQYSTALAGLLGGVTNLITVSADSAPALTAGNHYILTAAGRFRDAGVAVATLPQALVGRNIVVSLAFNSTTVVELGVAPSTSDVILTTRGISTGAVAGVVLAPGNYFALSCVTAGEWIVVSSNTTSGWILDSSTQSEQPIVASSVDPTVTSAQAYTYWRRNGSNIDVIYSFNFISGGTTGSGVYRFLGWLFSNTTAAAKLPVSTGAYTVHPTSVSDFNASIPPVGSGAVDVNPGGNTSDALAQLSVTGSSIGVVLWARTPGGSPTTTGLVSNGYYQIGSTTTCRYSMRVTIPMLLWNY